MEEEVPPTVEIAPEKQQLIGVRTVIASVKPMQKVIRTVGRVEYDEQKLATINVKIEGWIEKLYVNYTGATSRREIRLRKFTVRNFSQRSRNT